MPGLAVRIVRSGAHAAPTRRLTSGLARPAGCSRAEPTLRMLRRVVRSVAGCGRVSASIGMPDNLTTLNVRSVSHPSVRTANGVDNEELFEPGAHLQLHVHELIGPGFH